MLKNKIKKIRIAFIGDLLFTVKPDGTPERGLEAVSNDILEIFKTCDWIIANLECTLPGSMKVPTEPRVISSRQQIDSLNSVGIDVVSLGNNHAFDCFEDGFAQLTQVLNALQISWTGAGLDIDEALKPVIKNINDITFGFICFVDKSSGPSHFAGPSKMGIAPLYQDMACQKIQELKKKVNYVIVAPHWGMERFRIPSPEQIRQAHAFVDVGAALVVGHHPHVIQGMEIYKGAPIIYSLGNFLANKVYWDNGEYLNWNRFERTGCLLIADFNFKNRCSVQQIPVFDDGINIRIETSGWGSRCFDKVNKMLADGVTEEIYKREDFLVHTIKPILTHLNWRGLRRIRPRHFLKLIKKTNNR